MNKRLKLALTGLAFRVLSAKGALSAKHLRQLELTGLGADDFYPALQSIRSLGAWQRTWTSKGDECVAQGDKLTTGDSAKTEAYKKASSMFYLAGLLNAPDHPDRKFLRDKAREAFQKWGVEWGNEKSGKFQKLVVSCGGHNLHCNFYHPNPGAPKSTIILIPPLGSIKENIDFQVQPLFDAGYACITVDLPGVGETNGAMPLDAQQQLVELISYLEQRSDVDTDKIAMFGMSLGAYWSMKTAAVDSRVKCAVGISTPAVSGRHWDDIPAHYWKYFQEAFQTPDVKTTRQVTEQLSLFGVMDQIKCPVLLFHGNKDNVSQPDAMELFYRETVQAPLTTRIYPNSGHCCLDQMKEDVLPYALDWMKQHV